MVSSYFPQLEDEKIDAIVDQAGALTLDEVYNELEGLFAQLEADDVDAIADQIEALAQVEAPHRPNTMLSQILKK